ncbi:hypothetical protein F7725_018977 [Dissostichus mawsoni]|uniref:Uncharacterized protein n=1 Tax=Dissostichus mawsoni TaxID=36200 RepID=A0A7J5XT34_DISMA|nr:hypothetical protein F7725_018977 [Dissostichus mawsoni]
MKSANAAKKRMSWWPKWRNSMNMRDGANITCVIDHPGFQSNCLDVWVLQTAYHHYSKRDRQQAGDQPQCIAMWHTSVVRFCWGILGKNHRIPLPSCAIKKIQATFPSDIYTSFKYPALD